MQSTFNIGIILRLFITGGNLIIGGLKERGRMGIPLHIMRIPTSLELSFIEE